LSQEAATTAPILLGRNLVKEFTPKGRRREPFRAVDDVSLSVGASETLAIVGESGSGKSTTARLLARLHAPTSGVIELDGEDVTTASGAGLASFRRSVQVVFQDPFSSLNPRHNVVEIVTAPLRYQGLSPKKDGARLVKELMERVGLNPDHSGRYPHQFSGGQAQRIGIARALAVSPRVVICDEAVSALDVSVQAQVIDLLQDLQRDLGLSYVFIAHDLAESATSPIGSP
jgi:peptide/nickel transport system ATP-binding protein